MIEEFHSTGKEKVRKKSGLKFKRKSSEEFRFLNFYAKYIERLDEK